MKNHFKIISFFLTFFICFNFFTYAKAEEETISPYEKIKQLEEEIDQLEKVIKPTPGQPRIVLTEPSTYTMMDAGTTKDITVKIKNLSQDMATDVLTEIKSDPASPVSVNIQNQLGYRKIMEMNAVTDIKLKVTVDSSAESGNYVINFTHKYKNNVGSDLSSESSITIKVNNVFNSPFLVVSEIIPSSNNIQAGQNFTITAKMKNNSNQGAKNVRVSLDGFNSDNIFLNASTNTFDFLDLGGSASKDLVFNLTSNKKTKNGSYPLTLKISYNDKKGTVYTKDVTLYVIIGNEDSKTDKNSDIIITNITAPTENINVGQNFKMIATVFNGGQYDANNIKVSVKPESDAVVPKSTSVIFIPTLKKGESIDIAFDFAPTSTSNSQNYVVGFTVEYESGKEKTDGTLEMITFTQYQGANVYNADKEREKQLEKEEKEQARLDKLEAQKKDEKKSVPKIIIKEYSCDPVIVKAGKDFLLTMTFLNTNSEKPIKNIRAFLTVDKTTEEKGSAFTPVNSSNTFYIDYIEPKGEVTRDFMLYTIPDALPKTYTINVNFEYEDMDNNKIEAIEMVGVNVKQDTRFETSELIVNEFATMNEEIYVNFNLYNTGKVKLTNLKVNVDGNFDTSKANEFFGKLEPGSREYFEGIIYALEEGRQEGIVKISYEDEVGEVTTLEYPFTVEISPMMDNNMGDMMIDPRTGQPIDPMTGKPIKQPGMSTLTKVLIGVGVGIVVIIIIIVIVVKKKRKRVDFDEQL